MEDFTIIDGVAAAILLISSILAYARGFMREALTIGTWVGAAVVAYIFAPDVQWIAYEIPILRDVIGASCELAIFTAFGIIFVAALVVFSLFTPLIAGMFQRSAVGAIDRGFGFLFGLARGVLLIVIALFLYDQFIAGVEGIAMVEESKTRELLADAQARLATELEGSTIPDWFNTKFDELTAGCGTANGAETGAGTGAETPPAADPQTGTDQDGGTEL